MALVPAYDTRTGQKLPYFVPAHHIDHPKFGKFLSATEPTKSAPAAKRADAGDNTEKEK